MQIFPSKSFHISHAKEKWNISSSLNKSQTSNCSYSYKINRFHRMFWKHLTSVNLCRLLWINCKQSKIYQWTESERLFYFLLTLARGLLKFLFQQTKWQIKNRCFRLLWEHALVVDMFVWYMIVYINDIRVFVSW